MVAVASKTTLPPTAPSQTNVVAKTTSGTSAKPAAPVTGSAVSIDLSDRAKALLDKAKSDQAAAAAITDTFDEILAKRTDALSERLAKEFNGMNIPPEYATHLQVDKFGNVTSEGPWKEKIEKFFRDSPELAKELKAVAGLNSLKAAQVALDMYNEEKKSTTNKKQEGEAWTRYNIRSINIQALSGVMTMKDGKLRSAAVDYMDMLSDPTGTVSGKSGKELKERLA